MPTPTPAMAPGPMTPPPMATPPAATMGAGMTAQVRVELNNVVKSLTRILGMLKEVKSEEARAVMKALQAFEKVMPDVDDGVSQSEVKSLMSSAETAMPGPGAGANTGAPGGGLGPRPPSPMATAGMPFGGGGANASVPIPGLG